MSLLFTLASEEPNGWFIPGDPKELYFGAAAFVIVLVFLILKVWPLLNNALGAKGEKVAAELAAADAAQAAADAEVAALRARLGDAAADGRELVANAGAQADKLRADAAIKAQTDAAALRQKAANDVAGMRAQASADIEAEVTTKAMAVAEQVVRDNLDDATQNQLIESYINQVSTS